MNLYLSMGRELSFHPHWDDHEVIVIQLLGTKHWRVYQPEHIAPVRSLHPDGTSADLAWEGTLEPGAWLHVPRGWGHRVRGRGGLSAHLTIAVPRLDGLGVLEQHPLPDELLDATELEEAADLALDRIEAALRSDHDASATVARAVFHDRFDIPARPSGSVQLAARLLAGSDDGALVRAPLPGGSWVGRGPDDRLRLLVARGVFDVEPHTWSEVAELTDGLARQAHAHDPGVVRDLVRCGLLDVLADEDCWGAPLAPPSA